MMMRLFFHKTWKTSIAPMWEWPNGKLMLIPVCTTWAVWLLLLVEHMINLAHVQDYVMRFQALYARILLVFPVIISLIYIAACFPWGQIWIDFLVAILEAYCLVMLFALELGFAHILFSHEKIMETLLNSRATNRLFIIFGRKFETTEQVFNHHKWVVYQTILFRPLPYLIKAILIQVLGNLPKYGHVLLRVVATISLVLAVLAIIRIYLCLHWSPDRPISRRGYGFRNKFIMVKVLFLIIVLNNLIVLPLIAARIIPVKGWFCTPDTLAGFASHCQSRLQDVIVIIELSIVMVPTAFFYRPFGLRKTTTEGHPSRCSFLVCIFFRITDVTCFINGTMIEQLIVSVDTMSEDLKEKVLEDVEEAV